MKTIWCLTAAMGGMLTAWRAEAQAPRYGAPIPLGTVYAARYPAPLPHPSAPAAYVSALPPHYGPAVTNVYYGADYGRGESYYQPGSGAACEPCRCGGAWAAPTFAQPVVAYRPIETITAPNSRYYTGHGLIGQPKLYVEGQPLRNALRFLSP